MQKSSLAAQQGAVGRPFWARLWERNSNSQNCLSSLSLCLSPSLCVAGTLKPIMNISWSWFPAHVPNPSKEEAHPVLEARTTRQSLSCNVAQAQIACRGTNFKLWTPKSCSVKPGKPWNPKVSLLLRRRTRRFSNWRASTWVVDLTKLSEPLIFDRSLFKIKKNTIIWPL